MSDQHNHDHDHAHESDGHVCSTRPSALMVELREHIPFSVTAVAIGLTVAGAICILGSTLAVPGALEGAAAAVEHAGHDHGEADPGESEDTHAGHDHGEAGHVEDEAVADSHAGHQHGPVFSRLFFHLFHPAHMLFSAAATAGMFMRYERKVLKAIIVGLAGAVGVCGISDVVMPHVSLFVLGTATPWHLCVLEHPELVLPFAAIGVAIGIATASGVSRPTILSHSLHVLASTMASIFYMVGPLGIVAWIDRIGVVFLFVVIAVLIPCCLSDIVFPMMMSKAGRRQYEEQPHVH